jgi:DNA (cytosine-5)-methyltransferase 1
VIQETLESLDYAVCAKVLDAADYGVPQHRERIYIVGFDKKKPINAGDFKFPTPSNERVDIGQFIETGVDDRSISKRLQSTYLFKVSDGRPEILTPQSTGTVKTLVASYHKIQRLTGTFVADGPTGLRLLSESECKAIMGFPTNFKVPVSRTQMYRQFGNSVAVPVITLIAKEISKALKN